MAEEEFIRETRLISISIVSKLLKVVVVVGFIVVVFVKKKLI